MPSPIPEPGVGNVRLGSLEALELQLEESFAVLRRHIHAVHEEVLDTKNNTSQAFVRPGPAASSTAASAKALPPLELPGNAAFQSEVQGKSLQVPDQLKKVAKMHASMENVGIAAARARASGQPNDLTSTPAGQGATIRLHPRWMEMATKSDQQGISAKASLSRRKTRAISKSKHRSSASEESPDALAAGARSKIWPLNRMLKTIHPNSPLRLSWDMAGFCLIVSDAFLLPLSLAWDLPLTPSTVGGALLCVTFWIAFMYWCSDIFMTLNTGIYVNGRLAVDRRCILVKYLKSWFTFDLVLVSIDVGTAYSEFVEAGGGSGTAVLRSIRSFRVLRAMRLLRLVKMSKLSSVIEEASLAAGRQWLVLVVAILNTVFIVMTSAHGLACFWYLVGRLREDRGGGSRSWLSHAKIADEDTFVQYLHAFQWILTPPAPLPVDPDSPHERLYCILIVAMTVVVIGGSLSKITGTLGEIRTINSEGSRKRREVRQYLQAQHVSVELTTRIMRFVDYKLERQSSVALDPTLVSPSLRIELHVSQRGEIVGSLPIFCLTEELFPEVFAAICGAVEKHVYGKQEYVFVADSWAQAMHITSVGNYKLTEETLQEGRDWVSEIDDEDVITGIHQFSEMALFADILVHEISLQALTFGETYSLTGDDFARCLMESPSCTAMLSEYAKELLGLTQNRQQKTWLEDCSAKACESNSFYLEIHPDPKTLLENVSMDQKSLVQDELSGTVGLDDVLTHSDVSLRRSLHRGTRSVKEQSSPGLTAATLAEQLLDLHVAGQEEIQEKLRETIPELNPTYGCHAILSQAGEREKSESCCLSIIALVTGAYDDFTAPQGEKVRLTQVEWEQLRRIVLWTEVDATKLHAVLVLLAIRSLGKSRRATQQLPDFAKRPEQAVIYIMKNWDNVVPSVRSLRQEEFDLICDVLEVHQEFNLAQMLQGENTPASVLQLQAMIRERGVHVFRFYILFLLGFMSGLAGGVGSRFMNAKNSSSVIAGIISLLHILDSSPEAVYWTFVIHRANQLLLPADTPEDIALVRLACLSRVQDKAGFIELRMNWDLLGMRERDVLVNHFVADGINRQALVLEFLPDCMARAKQNKCVGVHVLLQVIADLVESLISLDHSHMLKASPRHGQAKILPVDLSDMSEFIGTVQNRLVFLNCISHCKVRFADNRYYLLMTGDNWGRTHESETDTTFLAYGVKELLQRQKFLHELVAQSITNRLPSA
eukprot:TRINITY_DN14482_c0_g1_i1.p1 TRINITY_DN14482_c0_g1~~TRINITY_DN14482_c0_g1_i1.p1  ORF type:complete len:1225 (-),score=207.45 TRINITY_DN14482_c0_g1_i1:117-3791(-)